MISVDRVKEIIAMNAINKQPEHLVDEELLVESEKQDRYNTENNNLEDSLTRFDQPQKRKKGRRKKKNKRPRKAEGA